MTHDESGRAGLDGQWQADAKTAARALHEDLTRIDAEADAMTGEYIEARLDELLRRAGARRPEPGDRAETDDRIDDRELDRVRLLWSAELTQPALARGDQADLSERTGDHPDSYRLELTDEVFMHLHGSPRDPRDPLPVLVVRLDGARETLTARLFVAGGVATDVQGVTVFLDTAAGEVEVPLSGGPEDVALSGTVALPADAGALRSPVRIAAVHRVR